MAVNICSSNDKEEMNFSSNVSFAADCSQLFTSTFCDDRCDLSAHLENIQICVEKIQNQWEKYSRDKLQFNCWLNEINGHIKSGQHSLAESKKEIVKDGSKDFSTESSVGEKIGSKTKNRKRRSATFFRQISSAMMRKKSEGKIDKISPNSAKNQTGNWRVFRDKIFKRKSEEIFTYENSSIHSVPQFEDENSVNPKTPSENEVENEKSENKESNLEENSALKDKEITEIEKLAIKEFIKRRKLSFLAIRASVNENAVLSSETNRDNEIDISVSNENDNKSSSFYQQYEKMISSSKLENEKFINKCYVSPLRFRNVGFVRSLAEKYNTV